MGLELHLYETTLGTTINKADLIHAGYDETDDEAMARLGRKLVAWIKEGQGDFEKWKEEQDRLCNCFSKDRPWTDPRKTSHSSSCRVMFNGTDEEYEAYMKHEEEEE